MQNFQNEKLTACSQPFPEYSGIFVESMSRFGTFQGMLLAHHTASGQVSMESLGMLLGGNESLCMQGISQLLFPVPCVYFLL